MDNTENERDAKDRQKAEKNQDLFQNLTRVAVASVDFGSKVASSGSYLAQTAVSAVAPVAEAAAGIASGVAGPAVKAAGVIARHISALSNAAVSANAAVAPIANAVVAIMSVISPATVLTTLAVLGLDNKTAVVDAISKLPDELSRIIANAITKSVNDHNGDANDLAHSIVIDATINGAEAGYIQTDNSFIPVELARAIASAGPVNLADQSLVPEQEARNAPPEIGAETDTLDENSLGVVARIGVTDSDSASTTSEMSDPSGLFSYNAETGEISLLRTVNAEIDGTSFRVTILAKDNTGTQTTRDVTIDIAEINEVPSQINSVSLGLAENQDGGATASLSTLDQDQGDTHTYACSDARFEFDGADLKLRAGEMLNHEIEPSLTLTLTTTDRDGLSHVQIMTFDVADIAEAPDQPAISATQGTEKTSDIATLSSRDDDHGETQTLSFAVIGGSGKFAMHGDTLVYLQAGTHLPLGTPLIETVTVAAIDVTGLSTQRDFTIRIDPVNDAPILSAPASLTIPVLVAAETRVGVIAISDHDPGDTLTMTLPPFLRIEADGTLVTTRAVTPSDAKIWEISVRDANGLETSTTIEIRVPADGAVINGILVDGGAGFENMTGTIGRVEAVALGDVGAITWSVNDPRVSISPDGTLAVIATQDFENPALFRGVGQPRGFEIAITATGERGDPQTIPFLIQIRNVNETPNLNGVVLQANENQIVSITMVGTDIDGDVLTYSIVGPAGGWSINPSTGLATHAGFNYEAGQPASVSVRVSDGHGGTATNTLTAVIANVNEAPHSLQIGLPASMFENITLAATTWGIDPEDGPLSVTRSLGPFDYEATHSVFVSGTLTDSGGLSTQTAVFQIQIINVVDNAPIFTSAANESVFENVPWSHQFSAYDPELGGVSFSIASWGNNTPSSYTLTPGGLLTLVGNDGVFNFEVGDPVHVFTIRASNGHFTTDQLFTLTELNVVGA